MQKAFSAAKHDKYAFGMFVSDILDTRADLGKYMWDTYKSSLTAHEQTIVSL